MRIDGRTDLKKPLVTFYFVKALKKEVETHQFARSGHRRIVVVRREGNSKVSKHVWPKLASN